MSTANDKQRRNAPWFTTWGDKLALRKKLEALGATKTAHADRHPTKAETFIVRFGPNK